MDKSLSKLLLVATTANYTLEHQTKEEETETRGDKVRWKRKLNTWSHQSHQSHQSHHTLLSVLRQSWNFDQFLGESSVSSGPNHMTHNKQFASLLFQGHKSHKKSVFKIDILKNIGNSELRE